MDPLVLATIVMVVVLVIGGVWGMTVISELMKARTLRLRPPAADPRMEELLEQSRRLESRLEQLEEEVGFFRELRAPAPSARLPAAGGEESPDPSAPPS